VTGPEDTPEGRELKALLCARCYRSMIDWITGRPALRFVPCETCVPLALRWLEGRGLL